MTRPRAQGFTLLELLISLTLLGGIGIIMFGGLWYGIQTWHRATVFDERADDMSVVRRALTQVLGHAYPLYIGADISPESTGAPNPAVQAPRHHQAGIEFAGTSQTIQFLAPTPQALGGAGMTRFVLSVVPGAVGVDLIMRAQPELTNAPGAWIASTVLDHANEIVFSYYGGDRDSGDQPKWLKRWQHQAMLPKLIRVTIDFPGFKWPDVMIAPRIAIDASCSFDPATMTCSGR